MKCRSIEYTGKEDLRIIEIDVKDPKPDEVQVKALACGVCAWDVHIYRAGPEGTVFPGHEGIGEVVKVGANVAGWKEGDWVVGAGLGFSERITRKPVGFYPIPKKRRPQDWIVEPVACIVTGIDHCNLRAADRIGIVGCGFMGQMFIQALAHSLLDRLIAIDVDPKRLEMAKKFGAADVHDARSVDVEALRELKIDTVVDCSGSQAGLDLSSKIVRPGGRLNLFGWNHGTASFPGDTWHLNGLTVVNSAPASALRDPWPAAIRLLDRGLIDLAPLVSHVVTLDEYPKLLELAAKRDGNYMKGVVRLAEA